MNNNIILCIGAGIACFYAGWFTNQKVDNEVSQDTLIELIEVQTAALECVDTIMWNNNIYDIDGSDVMVKYLTLREESDSIFNSNNIYW